MNKEYLKSFIYGGTDGIITIFNIISGIEGANLDKYYVIILGFGTLVADAISMAVSSYLSSKSDETVGNYPIRNSIITFLSFILFGLIPLLSFIYTPRLNISNYNTSLIASLISMLILGASQGYIMGKNIVKNSLVTSSMGMVGAVVSYQIAKFISTIVKHNY